MGMGNSATVCKMAEGDADIALIGLAVMGQNLILNMNDHGFKVVAYNRTTSKVDDFLNNEAKGTNVVGAHSLEEMVGKLKRPRRVMILVKAGAAVDAFIDKLVPLLEKGDIIIDGGNSEYQDSQRRTTALSEKGILFVGSGVSGGEEGARYGPSLMPGGNPAAWPAIKPIFQAICAKSGEEPCCDWVGEDGSGHFVKMVHNCQDGWREVVSQAVKLGVPTPCFSTALSFYDGYRCKKLPANFIQAQRDYFGAHTYELLEKPGEFVHTNWTGTGGNVSALTYSA